ncbi:MAG: electron transport complex subunit RsxB [Rhodanobacteraceae bacterium]
MIFALAALILLALFALGCAGTALAGSHARKFDLDVLIESIDAALPQTQCTRCGYPACRPYAEAVARGETPINRCPPGGEAGIRALAALTGQPVQPLDPACGDEMPPRLAIIDEDVCIGCTKCIQACPVDAIVGAGKLMHTIIPQQCTGCELCIPPCPVDCIAMVPAHAEGRDFARPFLPYAA